MRLPFDCLNALQSGKGHVSSLLTSLNREAVIAWHRARPGSVTIVLGLEGHPADQFPARNGVAVIDDRLVGDASGGPTDTATVDQLQALSSGPAHTIDFSHAVRPAAVFLDRDGTLIVDRHYLDDPEGVELLSGGGAALRQLEAAGISRVMVTNQSGVGSGRISRTSLEAIHQRLRALLAAVGAELDGIYICPHRPDEECSCRKPAPGLVLQAAAELGVDPASGVVVGDKSSDLGLAARLGIPSFLVLTGEGEATFAAKAARPDYLVDDLATAARICTHPAGLPRPVPLPAT